jgi:16S rRNA (cytosine967-C5)-methyltransferase
MPPIGDESHLTLHYRKLRGPVFTAPERDLTEYVAQAFSYPEWLVARWRGRYGDEETLRLCGWFNTPGRMFLRMNPLQTQRETLLEVLHAAGVNAVEGNLPEAVRLMHTVRVDDVPGFAAGWFSVQDESAMHAAVLLDPRPGDRVLDLCAAPGGKTGHMAERMRGGGPILAVDVDAERLKLVDAACRRLRLTNISTRLAVPDLADLPPGPFDRVLVDVPCSNTGVLGKRPEARWRIRLAGIRELAALQQRILAAALDRLAPQGRLLYSTCSLEPEENADVVHAAVAARDDMRLDAEQVHRPGVPGDGGYQAVIVRG